MSKLIDSLMVKAQTIRKDVIEMAYESHAPHIGSSLSVVEILTVLYFHILRLKPKDPFWKNHDRFLLSKGHASATLYSALANRGFFPKKKLHSFLKDGGELTGHPEIGQVPGIEFVSGSLGHGLAIGTGWALGGKVDKRPYKVFVLLSDGECDEGQVWEAALFAGHKKLDNLVAIIDYNKLQALGETNKIINLEPFSKKWEAFGWSAQEVDGHDIQKLVKVFEKIPQKKGKPTVIIAHTIKGKGISFMENDYTWHYKNLDKDTYLRAVIELNKI